MNLYLILLEYCFLTTWGSLALIQLPLEMLMLQFADIVCVCVCVCVCVWWVQGGPGSIHESDVQMRTDRNSSTSRLAAGRLINTSARKLAAFLPPWLLLLLVVARLSSLITGKFILLDSHLKQEDVLGNSSDPVTILT